MKLVNLTKISLGLLLAWGSLAHAEVAGRVLVAVGDASALRSGQEIKLVAGTPVETGDTLRVGDASNLQVRFTDEAIMALRPNTTMRIDNYAFANKADSDKSIFSLIKGGLRTITGVIGRNSRDNYAVKSETSTIGIRGTHFNLVHCNNDCRNTDGTPGQNGTFGGVTDGRIAVSNNSGQREFGKNEFFFVASKDALPTGLIAPPSFLRDRLEGQAKSRGKDKAPSGVAGSEVAGSGGTSVVTSQPTVQVIQPVVLATERPVISDLPAITQTFLGFEWNSTGAFADTGISGSSSYSNTWAEKLYMKVSVPSELVNSDQFSEFYNAAGYTPITFQQKAFSYTYSGVDTYSGYAYTYSYDKQASVDMGSSAAAGNLYWGRYNDSWTDIVNGSTYSGTGINHWAIGDTVTAMPTSGLYAYSHVGGTRPTDQYGNAGSITSGGAWSVNFGSGAIATTSPVTWVMPSGSSYSLNTNSTLSAGQTYSHQDQSVTYNSTYYPPLASGTSATCSNCAGSSVTASAAPNFFGSSAQGMAVGLGTTASNGEKTASVQAYKR